MFRKVDAAKRLPSNGKFVTTIDEAGNHRVCCYTEFGWNMRDSNGVNSPSDNLKITHWLEEIVCDSKTILGDATQQFEGLSKHHDLDYNSFQEGWLLGRMKFAFEP